MNALNSNIANPDTIVSPELVRITSLGTNQNSEPPVHIPSPQELLKRYKYLVSLCRKKGVKVLNKYQTKAILEDLVFTVPQAERQYHELHRVQATEQLNDMFYRTQPLAQVIRIESDLECLTHWVENTTEERAAIRV